MMAKRQIDQAALTAHFERRAKEKMYEIDEPTTPTPRANTSLVLPPPPPATLQALPTQDTVQQVDVLPAASVQTVVRTSQVDHSKGFLIRTLPLAAAFAVAAVVVAVGLLAVPLLSMRTLIVIFVTFCAVYAWAFWQDLRTSPAGIALYHTRNLWQHIHAERKFRHDWYREERHYMRGGKR